MAFFCFRTIVLVLLWQIKFISAQDECKDVTFPEDTYCERIDSWEEFVAWIDESVPGDELHFCPFDIDKGEQLPVSILWGVSIICVRNDETDSCTLRGTGILLDVQTSGDTFFQSLDFVDGTDHAVHVTSLGGDSSEVTRTFCYCTFTGINRLDSSRGGAFMTQNNAGIVNLFFCSFTNNFSTTRGAAIYSRTDQMNIVGCQFIDNASIEWGGAIFAAADAGLYVEGSTFIRNFGLDDYAIVVKPRAGSSVWIDGGDNLSTGGACSGFFVLADDICQLYTVPESVSPAPTDPPTKSLSPSMAPTSYSDGLCAIEEDDLPCIEVDTFAEMQAAISVSSSVTFCGGFSLSKPRDEELELSDDHDIRCISTCTLSGDGTHVRVTGSDSQVRVHNMKFMLSDSSAVRIMTSGANTTATTTLCNTQFWRNTSPFGGAISIARNAGKVNVVASSFTNNEAVKGGAIHGGSERLCIFDSVFINNVASHAGSAIFTFFESNVVIQSSYFALNSVVSSNDYVVVVKAGESTQEDLEGEFIDAGDNAVVASGGCKGFFVKPQKNCKQFGGRPSDNEDLEGEFIDAGDNFTISVPGEGTAPAA